MTHYLCLQNEVIAGSDVEELEHFVTEAFPEARALRSTGKHDSMPWDFVAVYVVPAADRATGIRTVAYLWKERTQ